MAIQCKYYLRDYLVRGVAELTNVDMELIDRSFIGKMIIKAKSRKETELIGKTLKQVLEQFIGKGKFAVTINIEDKLVCVIELGEKEDVLKN